MFRYQTWLLLSVFVVLVAVMPSNRNAAVAQDDDDDDADDVPAPATETMVITKHKRGWFREDIKRYKSNAFSTSASAALTIVLAVFIVTMTLQ